MHGKQPFSNSLFCTTSRAATLSLTIAIVFALMMALTQSAQAQTYKVIYNFTGGLDGEIPNDGLAIDKAGNLYGTAMDGGASGNGTVFRLSYKGSGWIFTPLYSFQGDPDGFLPQPRIAIGPDGNLYGTTLGGGGAGYGCSYGSCGTVYKISVPPTVRAAALSPWTETVLYPFAGGSDGGDPERSHLVFDQAGNLYGTTLEGGYYGGNCQSYGCGTIFELTPSSGGWTKTILHTFIDGDDGRRPRGGLSFDQAGNLYGTAEGGNGGGGGTVYQLQPSGSGWTFNVLYAFQPGEGAGPYAPPIFDNSGNLYDTTSFGGANNQGTVFELQQSGGVWTYTTLHDFTHYDGGVVLSGIVFDANGNLYGTTYDGGSHSSGVVFKLAPGNDGWTESIVHDFTGGSDGGQSQSTLILDANGNIYGVTQSGGAHGIGVVFEITPQGKH